jgi:uncharacterized membrane protein YkoI
MTNCRVLGILLVLLAGLETAAAIERPWQPSSSDVLKVAQLALSDGAGTQLVERTAQQSSAQPAIPPSVALRLALSYSPGSQGLGVDLVKGRRPMYAVKLKTGNRVHRVLVDAETGQIVGE